MCRETQAHAGGILSPCAQQSHWAVLKHKASFCTLSQCRNWAGLLSSTISFPLWLSPWRRSLTSKPFKVFSDERVGGEKRREALPLTSVRTPSSSKQWSRRSLPQHQHWQTQSLEKPGEASVNKIDVLFKENHIKYGKRSIFSYYMQPRLRDGNHLKT